MTTNRRHLARLELVRNAARNRRAAQLSHEIQEAKRRQLDAERRQKLSTFTAPP